MRDVRGRIETMAQSGLFETGDWARYVIDRPMATQPGTSFGLTSRCPHAPS